MEKYEVIIDAEAEKDLLGILTYITETLKEPRVAARIFLSIREQILSLDHMPNRHAIVAEEPYAAMSVRIIPVENYLAFYNVDEHSKAVHVFRILYNRREWKNLL